MRDLVRNCLRMRPEQIIVGEVRGPEAFDLLQAMNTGHDGSMGTLHANSPREALSRIESMITMGGYRCRRAPFARWSAGPSMLWFRWRDCVTARAASRTLLKLWEWKATSSSRRTSLCTTSWARTRTGTSSGAIARPALGRPRFWERARYYGEEQRLAAALDAAEAKNEAVRDEREGGTINNVPLVLLVMTAFGGLAWVFLYPLLSGERKAEKRKESVVRTVASVPARTARNLQKPRREQIEATLKQVEDRRAKSASLAGRIAQAGLSWSKQRFFITCGGLGMVGLVLGFCSTSASYQRSALRLQRGLACPCGCSNS